MNVSTTNGGWTVTKAIAVTEGSIVTLNATLKTGGASGRNGSYDYIQLGGVSIRFKEQDKIASVDIDGVSSNLTLSYNRASAYDIQIVIDQATHAVNYSVGTASGNSTSSTAITNVVFGHYKAGKENYAINPVLQKIDVSEEVQEVSYADYTINYIYNSETIKTVNGNIAIGSTVSAENPITISEVKYYAKDGETTSMEIVNGTNVLNIDLRLAETWNYTVRAVDASSNVLNANIKSGSVVEGESVKIYFPMFILDEGMLWTKAANNKEFIQYYTVTENNQVFTLNYSETGIEAILLVEAEDIEGATASSEANAEIRCSMGKGAYFTSDTKVTTLTAGKYKIFGQVWGNNGTTFIIKAGNRDILSMETLGYINSGESEFVITKNTDIIIPTSGNASHVLDLLYIQSLGEPTPQEIADAEAADYLADNVFATIGTAGYATFASTKALDLANLPEGVTAYKAVSVDASTITFESLDQTVPANTGILLKGAAGEVAIPIAASGTAVDDNLLEVNTTGEVFDAEAGYSYYGLQKDQKTFAQFNPATVAIPANKAYLKVATADARELAISFGEGDVTGIEKVESAAKNAGVVYNLAGQRVAQPTKGMYIVNGKKAIVK